MIVIAISFYQTNTQVQQSYQIVLSVMLSIKKLSKNNKFATFASSVFLKTFYIDSSIMRWRKNR